MVDLSPRKTTLPFSISPCWLSVIAYIGGLAAGGARPRQSIHACAQHALGGRWISSLLAPWFSAYSFTPGCRGNDLFCFSTARNSVAVRACCMLALSRFSNGCIYLFSIYTVRDGKSAKARRETRSAGYGRLCFVFVVLSRGAHVNLLLANHGLALLGWTCAPGRFLLFPWWASSAFHRASDGRLDMLRMGYRVLPCYSLATFLLLFSPCGLAAHVERFPFGASCGLEQRSSLHLPVR